MAETKVLKTISQETFDGVVRENIDDFEMDEREALKDSIEQFKSQGVNINIVIKEVPLNGEHKVITLVNKLSDAVKDGSWEKEPARETLCNVATELSDDLSKRYQACKATNVTETLFRFCTLSTQKSCHQIESLKAYCALVNGQPDEATEEHMQFLIETLKGTESSEIAEILATIFKNITTMQEKNRQALVKMDIINTLTTTMERFIGSVGVVRECCGALRALTLDDDIRVAFGQSHERSKMIVTDNNGLERFVNALKEHHPDATVAKEISSTLSQIMVRNEFCQEFIDLDGFTALKNTTKVHSSNMGVVKHCVNLVQAISRNDDVKILLMRNGVVEMLLDVLERYVANPSIVESSFAALTTLVLRNPAHCKMVADAKIAPIVVQAMAVHTNHAGVQKEACMLIRNIVARTREHSPLFLELGVEELIKEARKRHSSVLDDQAKAALRDLDLDVDLKQLWTGTHQGISR